MSAPNWRARSWRLGLPPSRPRWLRRPGCPAATGSPRRTSGRGGRGADADVVGGLGFELGPGATVALTGPSGAGKSTVVAAMLRFLDPVAGRLQLGGSDVRGLDLVTAEDVAAALS
jgi:ABC-type multidrug transport system fused ATPase/permease subunit